MKWIKVSDALPEINADGYSRYVLVYSGYRLFPEIAQYSPENTTFLRGRVRKTKTHWWSNRIDHSDRNGPLSEPTHWCDIVFPEETAPKGYDEAYLNECIAKASKTWEGVDVDKYMDEVRGNRPLSSDNSLGNEIERFTNDIRAEIIKW